MLGEVNKSKESKRSELLRVLYELEGVNKLKHPDIPELYVTLNCPGVI